MEENEKTNKRIGIAIKDGLQRKNITQSELAKTVGSTQRSISSYVTGNTQPPLDILVQICIILELNLNQILGIPEYRHPYIIVRDKYEMEYVSLLNNLSYSKKLDFIDLIKRIRKLMK